MAHNYEELMGMVEEVRDLLGGLTEAKGKGPRGQNWPFRWVKKGKSIGGTDATVAKKRGPRQNPRADKYRCNCVNYDCICKGPNGTRKEVSIDRGYKKGYNLRYRKWRAKHAKRFKPGKVFVNKPGAGKKTKAA